MADPAEGSNARPRQGDPATADRLPVVGSAGDDRNVVSPVTFFPGRRARARPAQRAAQTSRFCDMTEHIGLLAAAYACHAGLSRQAAVAAQVRAMMEEPSTVRAGEDRHQPPSEPVPPGGKDTRDPAAGVPEAPAPAGSRPPPVDPHSLPGPRLGELDATAAAGVWALVAELRRGEVTPQGQLIRLTRRLPVELAAQVLSVRDGGPALVRAEAVRLLEAADPRIRPPRPWP